MSEASLEDSAQEGTESESEGGQAPRVDITASASASGHYDPKSDVILSMEAMGARQTRARLSALTVCPAACCPIESPGCNGVTFIATHTLAEGRRKAALI